MVLGLIIGIVLFVLTACAVALSIKNLYNSKAMRAIVDIVCVVILVVCFVIFPFSFHTVETGEIAVVKYLGEAKYTRTSGTYFDLWITSSYQTYDTKVQKINIDTATYSSDAQTMDIQMSIQYQIMSEKVMEIAKRYGSLELLQNKVESIAIEKTKAVLSAYKAMDIIANRTAMSPKVEEAIKQAVGEEYYVTVTAVVITNIDFSDAFENAVEEKMIAEQNQLKAEYENQTKIAKEEADAKAKIITAEADAKAKLITAEAEAKANEVLERSLTDKILQQMYLDRWDGVLPATVAGDSATIMIPGYSKQ